MDTVCNIENRESGKTPSESYTEQMHMINHADLNGYKRLFGGTLLAWIDTTAGITAIRHCNKHVTTVAIDNLHFIEPAFAGDIVVCCGKITYTGNTSMEVCVKSYVEHIDGSRNIINTAYVVMVALDENERPCPVPRLIPRSDEEKKDFDAGIKRKELRKQRSKEEF